MNKKYWLILSAAFFILAMAIIGISVFCDGQHENTLPPVASGSVVVTPEAAIPTGVEPSIRGYITRITYSAESTEILIESISLATGDNAPLYDKALVKIDNHTAIARQNGMSIDIASLSLGDEAEVWFSDPTTESYPVLAYGQAIRVLNNKSGITGINNLPKLTISGSVNSLAVVTSACWKDKDYEFASTRELLEQMLGAHISAAPSDTLSLSFSREPDLVRVTYSTSPMVDGRELEYSQEGKVVLPAHAKNNVYIKVTAQWAENVVSYAFAVSVIASK